MLALQKTDEKQEAKEDEQKDEKEVGVGKDSPEKGSETNVEKEGISAEKKEDSELGLSDGSDQNEETDKSEGECSSSPSLLKTRTSVSVSPACSVWTNLLQNGRVFAHVREVLVCVLQSFWLSVVCLR